MMALKVTASNMNDLIEKGIEFYRNRDYLDALQCFSIVIIKESRLVFTALDHRAATHIKLGSLQSALRDGRRMIQEDKRSCLGYLRTGRILQRLDKAEMALEIYKYGLNNVSSQDPNFELLKCMHDKFVSNSHNFDLTALPLELAEMIMRYLDFRTVSRIQGVSRSWRTLLSSMPRIWSHIDFSTAGAAATMATTYGCIERSQGTINRATLEVSRPLQDKILRYIVSRCKSLEHLDLTYGFIGATILQLAPYATGLKTLIVGLGCSISLDTISQLFVHLSNLERAEFHCTSFEGHVPPWRGEMSKLHSLLLRNDGRRGLKPSIGIGKMLQRIPNVQSLTFKNWDFRDVLNPSDVDFTSLTKLHRLSLVDNGALGVPRLPSSLQFLEFKGRADENNEGPANMINSYLPDLRSLLMDDTKFNSSHLSALLRPGKGNLEVLRIVNCCELTEANINSHIQEGFLDQVTKLDLAYSLVNDTTAELLASNCHHLKDLNLSSTKVTGVGVKALVLKPRGKLECLILAQCASVSIDAVEFARSRGIHVAFYFSVAKEKAKKVRNQWW